MRLNLALIAMISLAPHLSRSQGPGLASGHGPLEMGKVQWLRDIGKAQDLAQQSGKAILILFQEVPGCVTCQRYGSQVLTHPLIVEAIENQFVPLAIYNNKGGEDGRVLKLFNEPSWNNPVVRIVDAQLKDIVNRLDGDYSPRGVTQLMIKALQSTKKPIPNYIQLLKESFSTHTNQLTFGMYCFWEGEKKLGGLAGVTRTLPGFVQGHEVVQVTFDPESISAEKLIDEAKKQECAGQIYASPSDISGIYKSSPQLKPISGFKSDREPQYYLMHSDYRFLPMLPIQASRVNSAIANRRDPNIYLSKHQIGLLAYYKANPDKRDPAAYQNDILKQWDYSVVNQIAK